MERVNPTTMRVCGVFYDVLCFLGSPWKILDHGRKLRNNVLYIFIFFYSLFYIEQIEQIEQVNKIKGFERSRCVLEKGFVLANGDFIGRWLAVMGALTLGPKFWALCDSRLEKVRG